jgi:serine/threonine-protein kinase
MNEMLEQLNAELGDRYCIERELARGGAAIVYVAADQRHERRVALKVLRPDLAAALGADRFLREIKIAAQLSHPHILPVHDSGSAAGYLYYVMPLVEGESLRDRLAREQVLSVADTVSLLHDVLDALHHAHGRNVVHRDIKPDNVMLTGRHALVTDFGVAKALSEASDSQGINTTGVALGTPAYMAPEQAAADPQIDHRADIYSVGILAYEMLAGRPPFMRSSPQAVLAAHVTEEPEQVDVHRVGIGPELAEVVMKCLEKDPNDRWQSAEEVLQRLDAAVTPTGGSTPVPTMAIPRAARLPKKGRVITFVAVLAAALLLAVGWMLRGPTSSVRPDRPVLVVLPFENLGPDEDKYFANGITDAVTARLATLDGLGVISRTSAMQMRDADRTPGEIAADVGASYVLEGTIQRERPGDPSSRVRITPQLIRASDEIHVWAGVYDEDMTEVFRVQTEIAERVATAMDLALRERDREALDIRPTDNLEAYEFYLHGHDYLAGNRGSGDANARRIAVEMLERAIQLDGSFAVAHAELSLAHIWLFRHFVDHSPERLAMAKAAADSAVALQPELAEARMALGHYHYWGPDANLVRALEEFRAAAEFDPNNAYARYLIAVLEAARGEWDGALVNAAIAADLDPREPEWAVTAGLLHLLGRRYADAERFLDRGLSLAPDLSEAYKGKIGLYLSWTGDVDRARQVVSDMLERVTPGEVALALIQVAPMLVVGGDYDAIFEAITPSSISGPLPFDYLYTLAEFNRLRSRPARARAYFDSLLTFTQRLSQDRSGDLAAQMFQARAYAGLGRSAEALESAARVASLLDESQDALERETAGRSLIRTYAMAGEFDSAVEQMQALLDAHSLVSVPYLRVEQLPEEIQRHPGFRAILGLESGNAPGI